MRQLTPVEPRPGGRRRSIPRRSQYAVLYGRQLTIKHVTQVTDACRRKHLDLRSSLQIAGQARCPATASRRSISEASIRPSRGPPSRPARERFGRRSKWRRAISRTHACPERDGGILHRSHRILGETRNRFPRSRSRSVPLHPVPAATMRNWDGGG